MDEEIDNSAIQVMHELTIEGYRITVYKKDGEFLFTWLMDTLEALDFGNTMTRTVTEHCVDVINIVKEKNE